MNRTRTEKKKIDRVNAQLEAFAQQLARDLYVHQGLPPHAAMEAAVEYMNALRTFRQPVPESTPAPAQTAAEILDEAEAAGALPRPLTEDEYGEAREIAGDLAAETARDELPEVPNADEGTP